MKRLIAITVMFLMLLTGCNSDIPEPAECVLCDAFPRHAPCLVDLNTGELRELEIYQPHHTKVAELSDEQYGGYMSLISLGEISGILLGADRVELEAPVKVSGMLDGIFCEGCCKLLKDNKCQGYILADLRIPKTPAVWRIEDGTSFSVRCYEVEIIKSDEAGKLKIIMNGTLNNLNITDEITDEY